MSILYIVATPIGNLEDISKRAVRVLKEVDLVLCEDTRVTKKLLDYYKITTPTLSYHQHSGDLKVEKIMTLLRAEKNLALVSDAGTPGISDPGGKLVSLAREELGDSLKIESVPGPSAVATALSLAGVGFERFLFLGFLPNKKGRQTKLEEISASKYPVVLYESKHRIVKLLDELTALDKAECHKAVEQKMEVMVARELTKLHESFYQGSPAEVLADLQENPGNLKGEFVVLIKKLKN